jgi:ABC-2 type transport system permease protein
MRRGDHQSGGFRFANATRRALQINLAFFRFGWLMLVSYPLAFMSQQMWAILQVFIYFFVSRLVEGTAAVGGDYYTFVIIGIVALQLLDGTLKAFGQTLDGEMQEGRLEALLVEPIPWRLLPFGIVQFYLLWKGIVATMSVAIALALGARFQLLGLPATLLILALGMAATLAIGILGASVKVLSKRSDPLLTFYAMGTMIFSGVYFPVQSLPAWIRPLSYAVPETYVIAAIRKLLMPGGSTLSGVEPREAIFALVVFCLVLYPVSLWLYGRSMEYARKLGLLAGY